MIRGSSLDTRLQSATLLDPVLQADISAEEFRGFINLMVWTVGQVSDGAFRPERTRMVPNLTEQNIERFIDVGLVERDDEGNCRIIGECWKWQSTTEELHRQKAKRDAANERQKKHREKGKTEPEEKADDVDESPFRPKCDNCGDPIHGDPHIDASKRKFCSPKCLDKQADEPPF